MRYKEFIHATAKKIAIAVQHGGYELKPYINTENVLSEDDAIEVAAKHYLEHCKFPKIKQLAENAYRVQGKGFT